MTSKTYAVYLRKSRAEELTDSTAEVLSRHREILQALAERMELEVSAVYEEVVSGEMAPRWMTRFQAPVTRPPGERPSRA